jgi:hypothetical protein
VCFPSPQAASPSGKKGEDDNSKDEVLEEVLGEYRRMVIEVRDIANDPALANIGGVNTMTLQKAKASPEALKLMLQALSKGNVMKMLSILDGKNGDVKCENLKKLVFKTSLDASKLLEEQLKGLRDAMLITTKFLHITGYGSEDGMISWTNLKFDVMAVNTHLDKQA